MSTPLLHYLFLLFQLLFEVTTAFTEANATLTHALSENFTLPLCQLRERLEGYIHASPLYSVVRVNQPTAAVEAQGVRPQPQGVERLAPVLRADTDGNDLHLILRTVLDDFALTTKAIGASLEAGGFHFDRGGCLCQDILSCHSTPLIDIVLGVRLFQDARFELFDFFPTEAIAPAIEVDSFALWQSVGIAPK